MKCRSDALRSHAWRPATEWAEQRLRAVAYQGAYRVVIIEPRAPDGTPAPSRVRGPAMHG
ncbi:hypothetical protein GCM10022207_59800 [Streptomyces lannensis]|uniref:Transposase n=1 Tax=Streptomyces lannensis TaxID=766498 RepID=A0ABP7KQ67_9ACTN